MFLRGLIYTLPPDFFSSPALLHYINDYPVVRGESHRACDNRSQSINLIIKRSPAPIVNLSVNCHFPRQLCNDTRNFISWVFESQGG